jgi:leader peptidase (prepilin peptidase) / N-methyltransferase
MTTVPTNGVVLALAGILGLAVGSFLNVVIHRVPRSLSVVRPPSACPTCGVTLRPWHNVPVLSWLALRGRCAGCGTGISARYPIVESITAVLFVLVTLRFGVTPALPAYLYLAAVAVALAAIDLDVQRLPDAIVLPSYLVGLVLLGVATATTGAWDDALRAVIGMAVMYGLYFAIAWIQPKGMGFGDVKTAGLLGLFLGWVSWSALAVGFLAGFFLGGAFGALLMVVRGAGRKTAIPYGPHLLAGAFLALFVAAPIGQWYGSMIGVS